MQKTAEVDYVEGDGLDRIEFKGKIVMKRLNFSEKNALEEEATDIKVFGSTPQVKVSTSKMKELALYKSIVSSDLKKTTYYEDKTNKSHVPLCNPYDLSMDGIRNLPQDVGEQLFAVFTEINSVSEKKNVK